MIQELQERESKAGSVSASVSVSGAGSDGQQEGMSMGKLNTRGVSTSSTSTTKNPVHAS